VSKMLQAILITFGLRNDPIMTAVSAARAAVDHSLKRLSLADAAEKRNAAASRLLADALRRTGEF
jgi:hypothetical protein